VRVHEKCEKPASHGGLHACTDKNPKYGVEDSFDQRAEALNCAHCGRPGGSECAYDGLAIRLHRECVQPWITAYEASAPTPKSNHTNRSNANGVHAGSSPTGRANPLKSNGGTAADGADANFSPQSTPEKTLEAGWRARL
jgi:hypothetical protein